jgi:type III secretion system TyeA family effector delivery regulator
MTPATDDAVCTEALRLLKKIVGLLDEKWLTAARFHEIADDHQARQTQVRIDFLTGLKVLAQGIPVSVFPDLEARDRVLKAAQEALDHAIDAEDVQA